jgi:hypothetical protein
MSIEMDMPQTYRGSSLILKVDLLRSSTLSSREYFLLFSTLFSIGSFSLGFLVSPQDAKDDTLPN